MALSVCIGLILLGSGFSSTVRAVGPEEDELIQAKCQDRYLWLHIAETGSPPQFEAVDGAGVHSITKQNAAQCGYTISNFRMDGFTTFRASYYSCYTDNQNDEVFTFNLNILLTNAEGHWSSRTLAKSCSPAPAWSQREVICEEDYMEVSVDRGTTCEAPRGTSTEVSQNAQTLAAWQLMLTQNGGETAVMSVGEAQQLGYSLSISATRVVFRSPYKQPQSTVVLVDGVPVEVIYGSLFFRQKLLVVTTDISMACTVNPGHFDGARLLWDTPTVMAPLVPHEAQFESTSLAVGVEAQLLDWRTATARGFTLAHEGPLVQIGVPYGAEGGYRQSMVVDNLYRETYVVSLFLEHVFSLLYEDGGVVETRHRLMRVVDTPLRCQRPFTIDQTVNSEYVFSVYLGNIPSDVILEELQLNEKRLAVAEGPEYSVTEVPHINGSRSFLLRVPFDSRLVQRRQHLGQGWVQYSLDLNFTLTILPQRESYYHHTLITAQLDNALPPEQRADCTEEGISFSVTKLPRMDNLWRLYIGEEPLTAELAAQRGYQLKNSSHGISLDVPVLSIGYNYENINVHDFSGSFTLDLREAKTLALQTSISKQCLFKTQELIVCSSGGTMTVVTTPTRTWPTVQPDQTSLLDRTCGPKQTDQSRVLFEFKLDSCGTRMMVGDTYVVYENEIIHDRQLLADGTTLISRDSKFKLTVRCFYPLSAISRLFVDRIFQSETAGFGSIKVLENNKDETMALPANECPLQVPAAGGGPAPDLLPREGLTKDALDRKGHSLVNHLEGGYQIQDPANLAQTAAWHQGPRKDRLWLHEQQITSNIEPYPGGSGLSQELVHSTPQSNWVANKYNSFQAVNIPAYQQPHHHSSQQLSGSSLSRRVQVPSRDKYVPACTKSPATGNSNLRAVPHLSGEAQGSSNSPTTALGTVHSANRPATAEHISSPIKILLPQSSNVDPSSGTPVPSERNIVHSHQSQGPQSIRVRPPSIFTPGQNLNLQSMRDHGHSGTSNTKQAHYDHHSPNTGRKATSLPARQIINVLSQQATHENRTPRPLMQGTSSNVGHQSSPGMAVSTNLPTAESRSDRENYTTSKPDPYISEVYTHRKSTLFQQGAGEPIQSEVQQANCTTNISHQTHGQYGSRSGLMLQAGSDGETLATNPRNVVKQAAASHIRIKPAPSQLSGSQSPGSGPSTNLGKEKCKPFPSPLPPVPSHRDNPGSNVGLNSVSQQDTVPVTASSLLFARESVSSDKKDSEGGGLTPRLSSSTKGVLTHYGAAAGQLAQHQANAHQEHSSPNRGFHSPPERSLSLWPSPTKTRAQTFVSQKGLVDESGQDMSGPVATLLNFPLTGGKSHYRSSSGQRGTSSVQRTTQQREAASSLGSAQTVSNGNYLSSQTKAGHGLSESSYLQDLYNDTTGPYEQQVHVPQTGAPPASLRHTRAECSSSGKLAGGSGPYGVSVHGGILRGQRGR